MDGSFEDIHLRLALITGTREWAEWAARNLQHLAALTNELVSQSVSEYAAQSISAQAEQEMRGGCFVSGRTARYLLSLSTALIPS